jgi:predicted phosphodiesterase
MKVLMLFIILLLPLLQSCSKPTGTVYEDTRLAQEEMVKFCLVGDLGRETEHQVAIAEALEREECHRIFFLGDLVYPKGIESVDDPLLQEKFLDYYLPLLDRDPDLVINLILGNHDHKGEPSAWKDLAKRYERFYFPSYFYMIDYGGLCMVGLDTSFYYYTAMVVEAVEQATWLTKLNSRLKDCDVKVAFTHHPLKGGDHSGSKDWNGSSGPLKAFLETYVIGKFDIHISGHVHILADDGKDDGTHLLISGTGGEVLGDGKPGFIVLRWEPSNPKRIGYSLREVDTQVSVINEDIQQQQEPRPEDVEGEHIIHKDKVEEKTWYERLFNRFF